MKPSAVFVRTGFPPNHKLLLEMVKNGSLLGYAFDEDHSTFNECEGNVFASPPMGWLTNESVEKSAEQWVDIITRAAKGEFINRVN
jgi:phosphoglycerate dehydrogenase-like enzyme